ncbi:hypothetical protein [Fusobacterium sp.]|uniref:hypothetical protein n=1 Tax=Fusobacterium sp. TaxID=68766 RepID=UPI0026317D32|nr:hypothetical protein [Fusobacterium sp.]
MERTVNKFIVVVKQLENGKFAIRFPDFEGITALAEREEGIEKVALGTLKTKLQEIKDENIEIPTPKGIVEVQKTLTEGEFTTYISVEDSKPIINKENLKGTLNNFRNKSEEILKGDFKENVEKIYNKSEEIVKDKIGNNVKKENYHFIGMIGGILFALSAFLPIISVNIPFFGLKVRVGVTSLSNLKDFQEFVDVSKQVFAIWFVVILIVMSGIFVAYSAYNKHNFYFKSGFAISGGLFIATFLYVFIQFMRLESEVRGYAGFSFAWVGLLIALILMGISFILTNKKEEEKEREAEEE